MEGKLVECFHQIQLENPIVILLCHCCTNICRIDRVDLWFWHLWLIFRKICLSLRDRNHRSQLLFVEPRIWNNNIIIFVVFWIYFWFHKFLTGTYFLFCLNTWWRYNDGLNSIRHTWYQLSNFWQYINMHEIDYLTKYGNVSWRKCENDMTYIRYSDLSCRLSPRFDLPFYTMGSCQKMTMGDYSCSTVELSPFWQTNEPWKFVRLGHISTYYFRPSLTFTTNWKS